MKLHELKIGDRFYPADGNKMPVYEVVNSTCDSSFRLCRIMGTQTETTKECSMEVVKL